MSFTPGKIIKEFTTKSGKKALLRYPKIEDAKVLMDFINTVSLEDTFIRFAGEQQTLEAEQKYLQSEIDAITGNDTVKLFCFVGDAFAGVCDVSRDKSLATRRLHVGIFGLVVANEFRGDGIGKVLAQTTIDEAKNEIKNLRMINLDCFSINTPALGLYASLGFKEWGRLPQGLSYKGEYVDEVHMALLIV